MSSVAIVDSGGANIASIGYAFERLGATPRVATDAATVRAARHVVLPGVGAARNAMTRLRDLELVEVLRGLDRPVLGICLGMQLLCEASDEGDTPCLGIVPGRVRRLSDEHASVPHMGWNRVRRVDPGERDAELFHGIDTSAYFYFVHSFALETGPKTIAICEYAGEFSAAIRRGNFFGVQFHPERSSTAGQRLLSNFLRMG